MKRSQIILLMALVLIVFSSCHEITVKTKINEDGSFTRTIIVKSDDEKSVYKVTLPYPIDDSWTSTLVYDSLETDKHHVLTYTKRYPKDADMNIEMASDTSKFNLLDRNLKIHKRFGVFYSYLTFEETIRATNPYTYLNYQDYLTPEDMNLLKGTTLPVTAIDSTRIEEAEQKAANFIEESITLDILITLKEGLTQLNSASLNPDDVDLFKDSILTHVQQFDSENNDRFIDLYAQWLGNDEVLKLKDIQPPLFDESNRKLKLFLQIFELNTYKQVVELPGLLTETNSISPVGNTISWQVDPMIYMLEDYTMYGESRVINYWGFVVSGIVLLLLILLLIFKTNKK